MASVYSRRRCKGLNNSQGSNEEYDTAANRNHEGPFGIAATRTVHFRVNPGAGAHTE